MKQKYINSIIALFFLQTILFAHSPVLQISDNEDGTIEVFGGFSTGQSAAGAMLKIKSAIDPSKILFEQRVPKSGYLTIKTPNEPYTVLLDSGPGHRIEKKGTIQPKNGFEGINKKSLNMAFASTAGLSILFILSSILLYLKRKKTS